MCRRFWSGVVLIGLVAKLPSDAKLFEYVFLCRRSWSAVVLVELVAKLPSDAKLFEYVFLE